MAWPRSWDVCASSWTSPLAVGFGISTAEHVRAVGELADGAIVGSAVINAITEGGAEGVRALIADLSGAEQRS